MSDPDTHTQPPAPGLSASDLAELMTSFNEVSARLQETHETLRAEVNRLNAELREANEELQRSKRLAALGEMAAGISHEIRNPLGSIRLYARMLQDDLAGQPEQRDIAVKIAGAVGRLNEVVGDVLAFSRENRINPHPLDAEAVLTRVVDACAGLFDDAPGVAAGPGVRLHADAGLLEQALVNVVRNGAEATRHAGRSTREMTLTARAVHDPGSGRPCTLLEVRDAGTGIRPEVIERMFNPFFTTRETGTGLGLAIVHRIVDAHRGRVAVFNNADLVPGTPGATVQLWLPEHTAPTHTARAGTDAAPTPAEMEHA
ncbi:MAG: sensor histidine kinase [Phycisphaerales bacterium JB040]